MKILKILVLVSFCFLINGSVVSATTVNLSASGACSLSDGSSKVSELITAMSSGDVLNFDCTVNLANTVTVSGKSNITITASNGGGFRATGIGTASNGITGGILFDVRNCSNCTVQNLTVDGGSLCTAVFGATNNSNTVFQNLTIRNVSMQCGPSSSASAAFQASGNNSNTYRNINIDRDSTNFPDPSVRVMRGMWLGNWWREAIETNPIVENNTVRKTGHSGIIVQGTGNVVVRNNTVEDAGCAGLKVLMDGQYNPSSTGNISGNQANRNDCHGLQLTTNYGARNVTIANNTFNENTQTGIYIVNEGGTSEILRNSTISGNTIRNNKSANLSGGMYFVHGADGLNISNNNFSNTNGSQTAGIVFGNDAVISNTNISSNTFSGNNRDGITFWSPPSNISSLNISNNVFSNNGSFAVSGSAYQSTFSGVSGSSNTFSGNGNNSSSNINIQSSSSSAGQTTTTTTQPATTQTTTTTTTTTAQPQPTTSTTQSQQTTSTFSAQSGAFVRSILLGSSLRNDYSGFVGFSFTVGSQPITVSSLGRFVVSGNNQNHTVKIIKANDNSLVGSVLVNTSGQSTSNFSYTALSTPLVLSANTTYYLMSQEISGGDSWYDFGNTILTTTNDASVNNAVYYNGVGYTTTGISRSAYVPVDFKYTVGVVSSSSGQTTTTTTQPATTQTTTTTTTQAQTNTNINTNTTNNTNTQNNLIQTSSFSGFVQSVVPGPSRNDYSGFVGFKMTVGSSNITVNSLGRYVLSGNSGNHIVKIVEVSSGKDIYGASANVSLFGQSTNKFKYQSLTQPIVLSANTSYYIVSQEVSGGDTWYDLDTSVTHSSVASVNSGVFLTTSGTWFPTGIARSTYVPVDFTFSIGGNPSNNPVQSTQSQNTSNTSQTTTTTTQPATTQTTTNQAQTNTNTNTATTNNTTTQTQTTSNSNTTTSNTNNSTQSGTTSTTSSGSTTNSNTQTNTNTNQTASTNSQSIQQPIVIPASTTNTNTGTTNQSGTNNNTNTTNNTNQNTTNTTNTASNQNNNQSQSSSSQSSSVGVSSSGGGGGGFAGTSSQSGSGSKNLVSVSTSASSGLNTNLNSNTNGLCNTKFVFKKTLKFRSKDSDVKNLQRFLNCKGFNITTSGEGSLGNETTYFGKKTEEALIKYQEANEAFILRPFNLIRGTGIFGEGTRKFVNSNQ